MFYWFLALILITLALCSVIVAQVIFHHKEKEDLLGRLQSKSLDEYEYYKKTYPEMVNAEKRDLKVKSKKDQKENSKKNYSDAMEKQVAEGF